MDRYLEKVDIDKQTYALSASLLQHDAEQFGLLCISGEIGRQYVLTPAHAKRIHTLLGKHITDFENRHGTIHEKLRPTKKQGREKKIIGFRRNTLRKGMTRQEVEGLSTANVQLKEMPQEPRELAPQSEL